MALKNQGIEHEVTAISEVDEYAILSYHAIHTADIEVKEASEEEMQRYMEEKNIPLDHKGKRKILKNKRLKDLYAASVASNNLGDISKITDDEIPKVDLFTYSFPCQDISLAGKQKGLDKNSGTRSSLLWECEKIIETVKPKYLLMENVKALVNKNNKPQFDIWLKYLEELGYKNFWQVLNAKDYGVPQNRERVFVVSIRKDIDKGYEFPKAYDSGLRLKDLLEDVVDEKYYLSSEYLDRFTSSLDSQKLQNKIPKGDSYKVLGTTVNPKAEGTNSRHWVYDIEGNISTIDATTYKQPKQILEPIIVASRGRNPNNPSDRTTGSPTEQRLETNSQGVANTLTTVQKDNLVLERSNTSKIMQVGMLDIKGNEQVRRVYAEEGLSPTLNTMGGGNRQPKVMVKQATKKGYAIATVGDSINLEQPNSKTRRGRVGKEVAQTLTTSCNQATLEYDYKIRKLTPNECWRLMGIADEDFEKASKVVSNSQLYKQAGNAIVVDVLEGIFKQLFNSDENNLDR